jgi:hypothetical protein
MDTDNEELLALAEELMRAEGLPLAVALDAAALVLDAVADCAVAWDRMAKDAREEELAAFAEAWDAECARLRAAVS